MTWSFASIRDSGCLRFAHGDGESLGAAHHHLVALLDLRKRFTLGSTLRVVLLPSGPLSVTVRLA